MTSILKNIWPWSEIYRLRALVDELMERIGKLEEEVDIERKALRLNIQEKIAMGEKIIKTPKLH